ncbi:MAG: hypothetical protein M0011_14130 [Elusimicrobia bacterium]|nr:hypothetical protein [Elusimicrobiota bacterium]
MPGKYSDSVVCAGIFLGAVLGACRPCGAQADAGDAEFRVVSMKEEPAGNDSTGDAEWDKVLKANNYDKLAGNDKRKKKAELAADFDPDSLDRERELDWYGAAEECAGKGRLPNHKELLKIWEAECMESTSAACSAVYWTSEKKGERALGVNFLNGYVVPMDLDAFAYVRCAAAKPGRKPADAGAKAGKKKGAGAASGIVDLVRNFRPAPGGASLEEEMRVAIAGAGGSAGALSWEVRKKGPGLFSAAAAVPVGDGELKFVFSVNTRKKTVAPADARARDLFKAITDPEIADGEMR